MSQKEEDSIIQFSARLAGVLSAKVAEHNSVCSTNRATVCQVTKVYKHAARTFPQEALGEVGINKWCLARVNMYLRMKCGDINARNIESKSNVKKEMSGLVFENPASKKLSNFLDATQDWLPNESDFSRAQEEVVAHNLNYAFESLDDIYFAEKKRSEGLRFNFDL